MKPITKVNTYVFAITTSFIYFLWNHISFLNVNSLFLDLLITFIFSLSFYKFVYKLLTFICNNCRLIRKFILGKYYFEGLWIGFYIYNDIPELCYETIEQTLDHITIKGRGFDINGKYISSWIAVEPFIDIEESKITYYYELNELNYDDIAMGLARATIELDKHNKACRCEGFAIDGETTKKQFFLSIKENDDAYSAQDSDLLLQNLILKRAHEICLKNKDIASI